MNDRSSCYYHSAMPIQFPRYANINQANIRHASGGWEYASVLQY